MNMPTWLTWPLALKAAIVIGSFTVGYASHWYLGNDNKVEQTCEKIIKSETGADIDLTIEETP